MGSEPGRIIKGVKKAGSLKTVFQLDEIDKTADTAAKMLAASDTYKDSIDRFVKEYVYNLGSSASVGAKYIIQEIQKAIKRHKEQE